MTKRVNRLIGLVIIMLLCFGSGCWSTKEVTDITIITLLAVDRVTENDQELWQLSARAMQAQGGAEGGTSGGVSGGGKGQGEEYLFKGKGDTLQVAMVDFTKHTPRMPFFGHMAGLIIGERAAKEGIQDILQLELMYVESRPRDFIMVTKGEAFEVLKAKPEIEGALSKEVKGLALRKTQMVGQSFGTSVAEVVQCMLSVDKDAVATQIKLVYPKEKEDGGANVPESSIVMEGLGVFRGSRLVGWLNKRESLGYIFMHKDQQRALMPIPVATGKEAVSFLLNTSKTKVDVTEADDHLKFLVTIKTSGELAESNNRELTPEGIKQIEQGAAEYIRESFLQTFAKSKELQSDFLGLMKQVHRNEPKIWKQVEANGRENISQAELEVEVTCKVIRLGEVAKKLDIKE